MFGAVSALKSWPALGFWCDFVIVRGGYERFFALQNGACRIGSVRLSCAELSARLSRHGSDFPVQPGVAGKLVAVGLRDQTELSEGGFPWMGARRFLEHSTVCSSECWQPLVDSRLRLGD
ncbi:hypothetical protein D9M69_521560 [compost metagenome]